MGKEADKKKEEGSEDWIELSPVVVEPAKPEPPKKEEIPQEPLQTTPIEPVQKPMPGPVIEIREPVSIPAHEPAPTPVAEPKPFGFEPAITQIEIKKETKKPPVETDEERMDPRLEKLMGKPAETQIETDRKETEKKDIKPWEIDLRGMPLKSPVKKPTPYELWMQDKMEKEGEAIKCPKCGTINYDLPYITGQKCKKCGFEIEEFENVGEKMAERDEEMGVFGSTRLSTGFGDTGTNLGTILSIPRFLIDNSLESFELSFKTSAPSYFILYALIYFASAIFILPYFLLDESTFWNLIVIIIFIAIGVSVFTGFERAVRVTSITTDNEGATFSGWFSTQRLEYKSIISIYNRRQANNLMATRDSSSYFYSFLAFLFCGWIGLIAHRLWTRDDFETLSVDDSSSSSDFTNNIMISTPDRSVSYCFRGGENLEFVRALAIIIYMTKKLNKKCVVSPSAIRAAEKGEEHYYKWQRRKFG